MEQERGSSATQSQHGIWANISHAVRVQLQAKEMFGFDTSDRSLIALVKDEAGLRDEARAKGVDSSALQVVIMAVQDAVPHEFAQQALNSTPSECPAADMAQHTSTRNYANELVAHIQETRDIPEFCLLIRGLESNEFGNCNPIELFTNKEEQTHHDQRRRSLWTNPFTILQQDRESSSRVTSFLDSTDLWNFSRICTAFNMRPPSTTINLSCYQSNNSEVQYYWNLDGIMIANTQIDQSALTHSLKNATKLTLSSIPQIRLQKVLNLATSAKTIIFSSTHSTLPFGHVTVGPSCESVHVIIHEDGAHNVPQNGILSFASKVKSITNRSKTLIFTMVRRCPNLERLAIQYKSFHGIHIPPRKWFIDTLTETCPNLRKITVNNFDTLVPDNFGTAMLESDYPEKGLELTVSVSTGRHWRAEYDRLYGQAPSRCTWTTTEDWSFAERLLASGDTFRKRGLKKADASSVDLFPQDDHPSAQLVRRYAGWPPEFRQKLLTLAKKDLTLVVSNSRSFQLRCVPFGNDLIYDDVVEAIMGFLPRKKWIMLSGVCKMMHRTSIKKLRCIRSCVLLERGGRFRQFSRTYHGLEVNAGPVKGACGVECSHESHVSFEFATRNFGRIDTLVLKSGAPLCDFVVNVVAEHAQVTSIICEVQLEPKERVATCPELVPTSDQYHETVVHMKDGFGPYGKYIQNEMPLVSVRTSLELHYIGLDGERLEMFPEARLTLSFNEVISRDSVLYFLQSMVSRSFDLQLDYANDVSCFEIMR